MTILLPLKSISTAVEPTKPGQIIYGLINRVASYGIAVEPSRAGTSTRFLLHSVEGEVRLIDAALTVFNDGGIVVGEAANLSLRIHDLVGLSDAGDYFNLLGVDGSKLSIVGRQTDRQNTPKPVFVMLDAWRIVSSDCVSANGHFWASSWDLLHVDQFGNEVIVLQGRQTHAHQERGLV